MESDDEADGVEGDDVVESDRPEDWQLISESPRIAMIPMAFRPRLDRLSMVLVPPTLPTIVIQSHRRC